MWSRNVRFLFLSNMWIELGVYLSKGREHMDTVKGPVDTPRGHGRGTQCEARLVAA